MRITISSLFLCFLGLSTSLDGSTIDQKPIVVIIPSYNNIKWYQQNLNSILTQNYENYRVIYIDDCSTDGMSENIISYIHMHDIKRRITYIRNDQNRGALANIYDAIMTCPDDEIIATVDGDDWLIDEHVLEKINSAYQDPNIWLTYGQYIMEPGHGRYYYYDYPDDIIMRSAYREHVWLASHLRTFYAWLFKKIKKEDLMHEGTFLRVTWDMAFMFPMLEMAGGRFTCMPDPLYVYNIANPINDFRVRQQEQQEIDRMIRSKERYQPLTSLFLHGK